MAEDILSQEEVDALLRGVSGEADEAPPRRLDQRACSPYDLGPQERIVRGRMPTLEIINERFARLLRIGLFNFMRRSAEISVGPVRVSKYSEFVRNLVVPTNLNLVHVKPLRGTALLMFDPNLVFLVVDNLFGGDGRFHTRVEGRDFTPTEQRIIQRMLDVVFDEYEKSWEPVHPLKFEYVRSEMNPQFANIATPSEVVVVTTFNIELGDAGGDFHVCMPYAMLEPIRDHALQQRAGASAWKSDNRWVRLHVGTGAMCRGRAGGQSRPRALTLASTSLACRRRDRARSSRADDGHGRWRAGPGVRYGVVNGQYALQVENLLSSSCAGEPQEENSMTEEQPISR